MKEAESLNLQVVWYYEEENEDMQKTAESIMRAAGVPLKIVIIQE